MWLTGPSGLHQNSPQGLNIRSIRFFDQISDPEIPITLLPLYIQCFFFLYSRGLFGSPNCIMESAENLIVLFSHFLFFRCILIVHNSTDIRNTSPPWFWFAPVAPYTCAAIFESVESLPNLCYLHSIVSKHLLHLMNCFALRITKLLHQIWFSNCAQFVLSSWENKKSDEQ